MKRFKRDYHVEDIEEKGACYIRKKTIEEDRFGTVCAGTLYYGEDESADIVVKYFKKGGGVIVGPAYDTEECLMDYRLLLSEFREMEEDRGYYKGLLSRKVLDYLCKGLILLFAVSACVDIFRLDFHALVPAVYFPLCKVGLMFAAFYTGLYGKRL